MDSIESPTGGQTIEPTPTTIFETINAHQRSAALRGAIELELFTAIGEGCTTVEGIASRCKASQRGIRILCDFLTVMEFLTKEENHYGLTPESAAFLDKKSPAYLGTVTRFMHHPDLLRAFDDMAELVRRGETLLEGAGTVKPDYEGWVEFARGMAPMMAPAAEFIGDVVVQGSPRKMRVLDIAAGHGLFGIAVAKRNPQAQVVALDWPRVLDVARENAESAGVEDQYRWLSGDALKIDYGKGFDVVLVTNFFHHFDPATCESLMRKMHACLKPGGRVITLEFIPNEDRVSPPIPAAFAMQMLSGTQAGDAYLFSEYDRMFRAAGFSRNEMHDVPRSPQRVIVSHR